MLLHLAFLLILVHGAETLRHIRHRVFFMFVRSVSSEAGRLKDRGNMFADSVITSVRAFPASP